MIFYFLVVTAGSVATIRSAQELDDNVCYQEEYIWIGFIGFFFSPDRKLIGKPVCSLEESGAIPVAVNPVHIM
jgi:hypothetical protein